MYAVFLRSTGLGKAIKLVGQKTVMAFWYTQRCLPDVLQGLRIRGLMLHQMSLNFLKKNKARVIELSPNSIDLAMYSFWLFLNLQKNYVVTILPLQLSFRSGMTSFVYGKFVFKNASMLNGTPLNTQYTLMLCVSRLYSFSVSQ